MVLDFDRTAPMTASGAGAWRLLAAPAAVLRTRGGLLLLGALTVCGLAAAFSPLADHLGYELAELLALVSGSCGLALGVSAARLVPSKLRPLEALYGALVSPVAALAVPVSLLLLNGLRRPACDRPAGLLLVLLLAVPSGLLASATGLCAEGLFSQRGGRLAAAAFALTLAWSLAPLLTGPQVFAFHHFGGMFPGPIYDEAVGPTPALLAFRACTLCYACALSLVALGRLRQRACPAAALLEQPPGRWRWPLLALLPVCPALLLSLSAERLHWQASTAQVEALLGGRREGAHVVLHFPREKSEEEQQLLLRDAEVGAQEVLEFLGAATSTPPAKRVHVFLYRSAAEKRLLVGAAETSFTKPWLLQIHTNDGPAPHPIVRHELAHALAARFAHGPFGVPGRLGGLVPDMAFIEGFAVAADWPAGETTVDQDSAALAALGKLPDLERLFAPGRFYAEAGPSAYASAGSLIRFLWRQQGPAALRAAYGSPEGLASLGPLGALVQTHRRYLATVEVPPSVLALAALRFQQPSILRKSCPHEVAELQREAGETAARGDARGAAALFARCALLEPDDPGLLIAASRSLARAGDAAGAEKALTSALAHPKLSTAWRAQLLTDEGDAAYRRGAVEAARAAWEKAGALPQPEGQQRALAVRRWMLERPARGPAVQRLLLEGDTGEQTWALLRALGESEPSEGLAPYLLARQAQNRGRWELCRGLAAEARGRHLPGPLFEQEALRIVAVCAARAGDVRAATSGWEELERIGSPARRLEAARALRRL
jgi:hypothetical protein